MKHSVGPTCPYCGAPSELAPGTAVYPHRPDLYWKSFWMCAPCDAFVGCHPGTHNALGRLANRELRAMKRDAHAAFDPLWQRRFMRRKAAYAWLAQATGIPPSECHIGMMDETRCALVVAACAAFMAPAA